MENATLLPTYKECGRMATKTVKISFFDFWFNNPSSEANDILDFYTTTVTVHIWLVTGNMVLYGT